MKLFGLEVRRAEERAATITQNATREEFYAALGISPTDLPVVTVDTALRVPAFAAGVDFLASTMAALPRRAYRVVDGETKELGGSLQRIVNEAPNPQWSAFEFWKYLYAQRFTGGRGMAWIERSGSAVVALWPMDPLKTKIKRADFRKVFEWTDGGRKRVFDAADVIDLPFMLKSDQVRHHSPVSLGEKALQLALAMNDFASNFFAGGGIPPLALQGPMPQGPEAFARQKADIDLAIQRAKESGRPFFGMPPGHELKPVGFDPDKSQMVEARRFQVEEIARLLGLPPVFLQDLTHGTFTNAEQQDLQLVKHKVVHLASQLEDELNLKLFGAQKNNRFIEHNVDGLLRGDLKSRLEALARGVQSALITPDEARELDNRAPKEGGDQLFIQGATVPLTMAGKVQMKSPPNDQGNGGQGNDAQD